MNLFKNRPFALLCFIFIATSVVAYKISLKAKFIGALFFLLCILVCVTVAFVFKRFRIRAIFCALCAVSILLPILSQAVLVDMRREKALSYSGERILKVLVVDDGYASAFSSEYEVIINEVDGETVSISSELICDFSGELNVGDIAYVRAEVHAVGEELNGYTRNYDEDIYIQALVENTDALVVISRGNLNAKIRLGQLRDKIADYMDDTLGEEPSALARGFLLGDKKDIPTETLRDFRRAGVSHLLAVSGLHISVIMGALELLLRKLCAPKGIRCVILSVSALVFLALTGFAMSAFRSVLMILCVYFSYLFVKESDPITSLFASVAAIMLIIPHSVNDVGLWLSFLATLGILSVYIPLTELWHRRATKDVRGRFRAVFEKVFFALLLTFVCNTFICIVVWSVFGEISVVALISNPILSTVSEIFTIMIPIGALLGNIPVLGDMLVWCVSVLSEFICLVCELFSSVGGAVISLRYGFAGVIITLMSISLAIMLVIKLKRKWIVIIPPIAAVLAFSVCLGVYEFINRGKYKSVYYADDSNDMVIITQGYSAAVCDISSGEKSFSYGISGIVSDNMATEISEYVLTHYHKAHISSIENIFRSMMVRKICLPYPEDLSEFEIMANIVILAAEHGVDVEIYDNGEGIYLLRDMWCAVIANREGDNSHPEISVIFGNAEKIFSYIGKDCGDTQFLLEIKQKSEHIMRGRH